MARTTNPEAKTSKTSQFNLPNAIYKDPPKINLPFDGMSRWNDLAPFMPYCREKFRQLVRAGKAPQPIRFSERCTAYPNRELHKFFADPLNYKVEVVKNGR